MGEMADLDVANAESWETDPPRSGEELAAEVAKNIALSRLRDAYRERARRMKREATKVRKALDGATAAGATMEEIGQAWIDVTEDES